MNEDSGDSDSDELDHRYYLWSDYDSYFISNPFLEVVYLFQVKKYITYYEIFLDQLHCTTTYCIHAL